MQTIAVASAKGGTGKTTLSAALAERARSDGLTVVLIDGDPQGSLPDWCETRKPDPGLFLIVAEQEKIVEAFERARSIGVALCIIDTPPGYAEEVLRPSIRVADFVVIPVRPSPGLDVLAIDAVVEECNAQRRPFVMVLSQVIPRVSTENVRRWLATKGPVCKQEIGLRQVYVSAMGVGLTAAERDERAREEIDGVWTTIKGMMKGQVA